MEEGKFFYIQSVMNDLVMDIEGGGATPAVPVVMWEYEEGKDNQLWWIDYEAGVIRSKLDDNMVLDLQDGYLVINQHNPDEYNQKWRVAGDRVCREDNEDSVLDIEGCNPNPGARVLAWDYNGQDNQKWNIEYV